MQDRVELENIKYVDHPEIKVDEHESTEMPFRYVLDSQGQPIFPDVSLFDLKRCTSIHADDRQGHDRLDQKGFREGN